MHLPESDLPILEPIGRDPRVTPHLPAVIDQPTQAQSQGSTTASDTISHWTGLREDDSVFGDTRVARLAALRGDPVFEIDVRGQLIRIGINIPREQGDVDAIMAEIARMLGAELPY